MMSNYDSSDIYDAALLVIAFVIGILIGLLV